jgi:hypothetical protein
MNARTDSISPSVTANLEPYFIQYESMLDGDTRITVVSLNHNGMGSLFKTRVQYT